MCFDSVPDHYPPPNSAYVIGWDLVKCVTAKLKFRWTIHFTYFTLDFTID